MDFHEYAKLFPMMQAEELQDLVKDIKSNGLIERIVLYEEKILDGRNRYLACGEAGVKPHYDYYKGDEPVSYVISKNVQRRHLNGSQKAMIATEVKPALEKEAKNRQGARTDLDDNIKELVPESSKQSREHAGELFGVSGRYVSDAEKIKREAPEYVKPIVDGDMTITQAKREMKRSEVIQNLESVEAKQAKELEGVYDVIVIDPPWPMEKIERDVAPTQVKFDYPTMNEVELGLLDIPCADDCHVWLWTTHKFLPMALRLLEMWEMKYVCAFTWHKPGGFQPFGLPQYNCEFALYARRGSPKFIDFKNFMLCFDAPRTGHSQKPDAFYDLIRRVTAGRRLDMFNRREIDGFDGWGKESI